MPCPCTAGPDGLRQGIGIGCRSHGGSQGTQMGFSEIVGNRLGKAFGGGAAIRLGKAFGGGGEAFAGSGGGGKYPRRQGPTRGIHTASWWTGSSRVTTKTHGEGESAMLSNSYSDGRR